MMMMQISKRIFVFIIYLLSYSLSADKKDIYVLRKTNRLNKNCVILFDMFKNSLRGQLTFLDENVSEKVYEEAEFQLEVGNKSEISQQIPSQSDFSKIVFLECEEVNIEKNLFSLNVIRFENQIKTTISFACDDINEFGCLSKKNKELKKWLKIY